MRTLYLTVSHKPTKVIFEKSVRINGLKTSARVDFTPGFLSFKELQKAFEKLGAQLTLEEHTQKAIIKAPPSNSITLSDNLRDLLGSDTKTFQAASLTTMDNPCDMLSGLKYFVVRCDEINGSFNQRSDENSRSVPTNILGLMGIKSFVFIGGTQYHDQNDFTAKRVIDTSYFNELTFTLSGNNSKDVGKVFLELMLSP